MSAGGPIGDLPTEVADTVLPPSELATATGQRRAVEPRAHPHRVGRFVVLDTLGRGGMGVVWSAYDPKLERKVAIKLIVDPDGGRSIDRARLVREAKAMAQLSHPNVVQVYDVGVSDDRPYIAMELVDGITLSQWLEQDPARPIHEIVGVLCDAAGGLAAAHEAGLVHRDFKPANVMVTSAGRVVVLDFGVARVDASSEPTEPPLVEPEDIALADPLTAQGAAVGTPAYMSPEQLQGLVLDARSDQFSLCVTLYEAVALVPPFSRQSWVERLEAVEAGTLAPPQRELSAGLRAALARGLRADPAERWPSMQALVEQLAPRRRRGTAAPWVGLGATVVAAAAFAVLSPGSTDPCEGLAARVDAVWSPAARQTLVEALDRTGAAEDDAVRATLSGELDGFARDWAAQADRSCEASHHDGTRPVDQHEQTMACLGRGLTRFDALLDAIAESSSRSVESLAAAVARLPAPSQCFEEALARREVETWTGLEDWGRDLSAVHDMVALGDLAGARARLQARLKQVDAQGQPAVAARTFIADGVLLSATGEDREAERRLRAASSLALGAGDDLGFAEAVMHLTTMAGRSADFPQAHSWGELGLAAVRRAGGSASLESKLDVELATVLQLQYRLGEAERRLQHALRVIEARWGPQDRRAMAVLANLGVNAQLAMDLEQAVEYFERAHEIGVAVYGAASPALFGLRNNLAAGLMSQGKLDEAERVVQRLLRDIEARRGAGHLDSGAPLVVLAQLAYERGDDEAARSLASRALAVFEAHDSVVRAVGLSMFLAEIDERGGALAPARRRFSAARTKLRELMGTEHVFVGQTLVYSARVELEAGEVAQARDYAEQALELLRGQGPEAELPRWVARLQLGRVERAEGNLEASRTIFAQLQAEADAAALFRDQATARLEHARTLLAIETTSTTLPTSETISASTLLDQAAALVEGMGPTWLGEQIAAEQRRLGIETR